MDHSYLFADGKSRILTPGVSSMADVKTEILEHTPELIVSRSVYPNGFEIVLEQRAGFVLIHCNQSLIDNGDGSFTAPTDI